MTKRIAIIQGHPDSAGQHFIHALAAAYEKGAQQAGHEIRTIRVADLDFPLLRSEDEFSHQTPVEDIQQAQETVKWAEHVVILYPLWLGSLPAILKGFLEQLLRPGYAMATGDRNGLPEKQLKGRSARIIVTMGMPALFYSWFYRAHSLKNLKRNILSFCGFAPIRNTLIGSVANLSDQKRQQWLAKMEKLGQQGQ